MGDADISFDSIDSDLAGGVNPASNMIEPVEPEPAVVVLNQQNTLRSTQRPSKHLSPDFNESRTMNVSSVSNVADVPYDNATERLVSRTSKGRSPVTGSSIYANSISTPGSTTSNADDTPDVMDTNGTFQCTRIDKKINRFPWAFKDPHLVLRFADVINFRRQHRQSLCVMCGRSGDNPAVTIPSQNKDVCRDCDVAYWLLLQHTVMIKFCKGCKNFVTLSEFAEKPEASKCSKCRQRGRDNYFSRKKNGGGASGPGGKRGDGNSFDDSYGGAPGSASKRKKGNGGTGGAGSGGGGNGNHVYTSIDLFKLNVDTNQSLQLENCHHRSQSCSSRGSDNRLNSLSTPSMSLPPRAQAPNASTKAATMGTPVCGSSHVSTSRKGRRRVAPVFFDETEYGNAGYSSSNSTSKCKHNQSRGKNIKNDNLNLQMSNHSNRHSDMLSYHMIDDTHNSNNLPDANYGFNYSNSKKNTFHNRASPRSVSFMGSLTPLSMSSELSSGYVSGSSTSGMSANGNECGVGTGAGSERAESPFAGMEVPGGDRGRWQWDPSNPLMHLANLCTIMKDDDGVSDEEKNEQNSPSEFVQLESLAAKVAEGTEVKKDIETEDKSKLPPLPSESNIKMNSRNNSYAELLVAEGIRLSRSMSMSSVTSNGSFTGSSSGTSSVGMSPDVADSNTDVVGTKTNTSIHVNPEQMEISLTPESPSTKSVDSLVGSPDPNLSKAIISAYNNGVVDQENKLNINTHEFSSGTTSATTSADSSPTKSPTKVMSLTSTTAGVIDVVA